jgi:tetratricopeptide (TPR) repeat protein
VRFRVDTSLPSDAFRVEVLQREFPVVRADPDRALDAIVTELRFRMAAARKWWLRPDEAVSVLDRVPGETALWLARQYTTGELTFLLRAAMAPEGAREGSRADPFGGAPPEWSIRALPELVPALVFCASTADPQDGRALVACLQKAQAARLGLTHYSAPSGRASELAAAGARALVAGRVSEASQAFRTAAAADAGAAEQSFLAAFPQLAALAQAKRLQDACPLPKPAGNLSAGLSMRADLYDLLAQPAVRVPLELRRRLGIYLVAAEVQANGPAAASGLLEQVLASRREQAWPPAEEYVLAYRLLDTGDRTLRQPVQFDPARNLLDDAFRRWPDRDAEEAFKQLAEYCGSLPEARWCWSMLRPLAELHLRSPNIPYELGWRLADVGGDRQMSETALQMLQLAERNLPALPPQEREARRSVLDWSKAVAHLSLAQYQVKDSLLEAERLLEAGVRNRSSNPGWVQPDLVFGSLAETYMLEGRLPEAAALMEKACGLFPDSPYLMERKFFLRLAQGDAAGARSVAEEMLKANSKEERGIFVMAVIELLTGGSAAETWADRFFQTNHPNRDYVRMMLYWRLRCAGNDRQAQQLLEERWTNITESLKDSSWEQRASQEGATVWREKLIGYYLGKVSRDEIFGPLLDEKKFEASLFRSSGEPLSGLRCEAHFYDALLQGVTGKPQDRDPRQLNQLKKAIASEHVLYYEYQMARYLHGQPPRARVGNR